jgi:hypothetical protein
MKILIYVFLLLTLSFLNIGSVYTQPSDYQGELLVGVLTAKSPELELMTINFRGEQQIFSEIPISTWQIYLSPDRRFISTRTPEGDLLILNSEGDEAFTYDFEFATEFLFNEWYVWGWFDETTLLISHDRDAALTFFTLNITEESAELRPSELHNAFFRWNTDAIQDWRVGVSYMLQFSPDFTKVVTPAFDWDENALPYGEQDLLFWDLEASTESPQYVVSDSFPWWYRITLSIPAYSHDSSQVILPRIETTEIARTLPYLYASDSDLQARPIDPVACPDELCDPSPFTWSPDDRSIVYWQTPSRVSEDTVTQLILVDVPTGEHRVLLERNLFRTPLYWSGDSKFIAFSRELEQTETVSSYGIEVVDVETGEATLLYEETVPEPTHAPLRVLGWLQ